MSIYNGQCDHGSKTNAPCLNAATHYSYKSTYAFCDEHGSNGTRLKDEVWADVAQRYDKEQRRNLQEIEEAESKGLFLWCEDRIWSPRELRRYLASQNECGFGVGHTIAADPEHFASGYEREADDLIGEAKSLRAKARRIRREMEALKTREAAFETPQAMTTP